MAQKLKNIAYIITATLAVVVGCLAVAPASSSVFAAPAKDTETGSPTTSDTDPAANSKTQYCSSDEVCDSKSGNCSDINKCDIILKYINPFINFLAALVGVAVVISIVVGGIQYGSSAGDPGKVTAAKNRIRNAILALVTFLFLYALLNFLIPGGLF